MPSSQELHAIDFQDFYSIGVYLHPFPTGPCQTTAAARVPPHDLLTILHQLLHHPVSYYHLIVWADLHPHAPTVILQPDWGKHLQMSGAFHGSFLWRPLVPTALIQISYPKRLFSLTCLHFKTTSTFLTHKGTRHPIISF